LSKKQALEVIAVHLIRADGATHRSYLQGVIVLSPIG